MTYRIEDVEIKDNRPLDPNELEFRVSLSIIDAAKILARFTRYGNIGAQWCLMCGAKHARDPLTGKQGPRCGSDCYCHRLLEAIEPQLHRVDEDELRRIDTLIAEHK